MKLVSLFMVIKDVWRLSTNMKKVKKTGLCVALYGKAAKVLLSSDVQVDLQKDARQLVQEVGVKLIKEVETAIEKDKTMSNLKGKVKEIKRLVEA